MIRQRHQHQDSRHVTIVVEGIENPREFRRSDISREIDREVFDSDPGHRSFDRDSIRLGRWIVSDEQCCQSGGFSSRSQQ